MSLDAMPQATGWNKKSWEVYGLL